MKRIKYLPIVLLVLALLVPAFVLAEPPDKGGPPDDYTGELYGDLYVILRDDNGVPMLDSNGCVQPTQVKEDGGILTLEVASLTYDVDDGIICEVTEETAFIPLEVEFGRLNLGRSPEGVLAHAFDEAVNAMNAASDIQLDPAGRFLLTLDGESKTIDSPLENLALYIKIMKDGHLITLDTDGGGKGRGGSGGPSVEKGPPEGDGPTVEDRPVLSSAAQVHLFELGFPGLTFLNEYPYDPSLVTNEELGLTASLLAGAADKTGHFTIDKVVYVNSIYGINALGALVDAEGKTYFDFGSFTYSKPFGSRSSGDCALGSVYVLQLYEADDSEPDALDLPVLWAEACMPLLTSVQFVPVRFVVTDSVTGAGHWDDGITNVAGFTQAANDALKVIEFIHNYSVPEDIYGTTP